MPLPLEHQGDAFAVPLVICFMLRVVIKHSRLKFRSYLVKAENNPPSLGTRLA